MAEYTITLTEEEFDDVICGLNLVIDRCCDDYEEKPIIELIEKLKKQPTADVAEIIYCRSCKHRDKKGVCEKFRQRYPFFPEDNFYCGFGERGDN